MRAATSTSSSTLPMLAVGMTTWSSTEKSTAPGREVGRPRGHLHPVQRELAEGGETAAEILRRFRAAVPTAPDRAVPAAAFGILCGDRHGGGHSFSILVWRGPPAYPVFH